MNCKFFMSQLIADSKMSKPFTKDCIMNYDYDNYSEINLRAATNRSTITPPVFW